MDFKLLIEKALAAGFSDFEVYLSKTAATTLSLFNGEVDKTEIKDSLNITARGIYNNKMASLRFETEEEDFDKIVQTLKANALSLNTKVEFEIYPGDSEYPKSRELQANFADIPISKKIDLLKEVETKVKESDPRIINVPYLKYNESETLIKIQNSKGLDVSKENEMCFIAAQAVARENEQTVNAFEVDIALTFADLEANALAEKLAKKAISKLNAKPVPSKIYPIVFDNKAMSDLFGTFQSLFSGEAAVKKLTPLIGREGEKIFSEKITIIDDPMFEGSVSWEPFDDEGVACTKKALVEKGIFKGLMHNLKTARYFKTKSTGNGFKGGADIGVGGVNVYIEPGEQTQAELIADIKEGLLITELAGLHAGANAITGDFSAQSSGFLIEDGKITKPVTLIVVSGNFLKMMNEIDGLGNDLKLFYNGPRIATPSIRFKGLPVSGK